MPSLAAPFRWLWRQPYLLLPFTFLFWSGNTVLGRAVADSFPPAQFSQLRWTGASLILLPFAWRQVRRDWPVLRRHLPILSLMALTGVAVFNTMQYMSLQHTTAMNVVLLHGVMPLLIAGAAFLLYRDRLTGGQIAGIAVSMGGVAVIVTGGELQRLLDLRINPGDALFVAALGVYSVYSALLKRRPAVHWLSFLAATAWLGTVMMIPITAVEFAMGARPEPTAGNALAILYVCIFPSILAYVCFNRGVELIGPNRTGPFFHLIVLFGALMSVAFLGEAFTLAHAGGTALIAGGIALASVRAGAPSQTAPEP